ncbi:MAG TPA: polymer-forming cytoskeletal protein, partial [Gemmatimonadaceae bacterium]
MRKFMIALAVVGATTAAPAPAAAQVRPGRDTLHLDTIPREALPRDVAREATEIYNRTATLRSTERLEIAAGRVVAGDVAVLNGPVILAGRINGRLLAINSDVVLAPGARIDGDLMVIGGEVEGRDSSFVGGEIRIYRQRLLYDQSGERIVATRDTASDDRWWRRWERRRQRRATESRLLVASAGAYNRTEGLPVIVGPSLRHRTRWGAVNADAFAVLRTETSFRHDRNDVGHDLRAEVRLGRREGIALEGRAFNVADPVERWQLSDLEAGLATFVVKRDYRDYFTRHGGSAGASLFREGLGKLSLTYAHEAWGSRTAADPWVLFRDNVDWRPNPMLDAGRLHLLTGGAVVDTRNDEDDPWAGWYVSAQVERGEGELTTLGVATPSARRAVPGPVAYTRGFMDARRYNRLGPGAQLNFRLVLGGWMSGDELPLERRLSVDGPGALPGYGFRAPRATED